VVAEGFRNRFSLKKIDRIQPCLWDSKPELGLEFEALLFCRISAGIEVS
jgi:hypothetical protein